MPQACAQGQWPPEVQSSVQQGFQKAHTLVWHTRIWHTHHLTDEAMSHTTQFRSLIIRPHPVPSFVRRPTSIIHQRHHTDVERSAAVQDPDQTEDDDVACSILSVKIDNENSPNYTKLSLSVMNYSSLLRTVAWTLNGESI